MRKLTLWQELGTIEKQYLFNLFYPHYLRDIDKTHSVCGVEG